LKNEQLIRIAGIVLKMIDILKDKEVGFMANAIVAAACGHLLFPFDIIPDAVPLFGFLDDASILMIAIAQLAKLSDAALQKYKLDRLNKYQLSPIVYSITYNNNRSSFNYIEENKRRIWFSIKYVKNLMQKM